MNTIHKLAPKASQRAWNIAGEHAESIREKFPGKVKLLISLISSAVILSTSPAMAYVGNNTKTVTLHGDGQRHELELTPDEESALNGTADLPNGQDAFSIINADGTDRDKNIVFIKHGASAGNSLDSSNGNGGDAISGNNITIINNIASQIRGGNGNRGGYGIKGDNLNITNNSNIFGGDGNSDNGGNGGDAINGDNLTIINDDNGYIYAGTGHEGGTGIKGNNLNITNINATIYGGFGYYRHNNGGDAISGNNITITNINATIAGGAGAVGGNGISGSDLTILNGGTIASGPNNHSGVNNAAINFIGGTNTLTLNDGSEIKGNIVLDSATSGGAGNSLSVTSNISDDSKSTVDGNLKAGDNTAVSFSGDRVTFSGDTTFGEGSSLTLSGDNGTLATKGAMSFDNGASVTVNTAITDWKQDHVDLLSADKGITGLTGDNYTVTNPLLVDGAKDYTTTHLTGNALTQSLAWNAQDGSAHGEFALKDGASVALHTTLADNTSATHTSGWDGKSLTKSGNGELILAAQNTYTGTTTINGGILKTATENAIAGTSGVNISDGATLNLNGHNQTFTSVDNSGTLLINDTGAAPLTTPVTVTGNMTLRQSGLVVINNGNNNAGQTLKVEGDWKGEGGTVSLGVVLGDDNSKADQLNISGHASGATNVLVANENGSGAQTLEGIKLISTGSSDNNAFVQKGRIVAGSYDYHLQQGTQSGKDTSNWYLTSYLPNPPQPDPVNPVNPVNPVQPNHRTHVWRPEAGSYTANLMAANTMFSNTLEDRHGSVVTDPVTGKRYETTLWARAVGGHNTFRMTDGQSRTQANRMVYQMGGEMLTLSFAGDDGLHLGVMGAYGHQDSKTINSVTGYSTRGTVSGYATGLYGTWFSDDDTRNGLYVDSWMQYGWFDNTVKGEGLAEEKYDSNGLMASLETGYVWPAYSWMSDNGTDNTLYLRPLAQVTWSGVKADDHTERNGTVVKSAGTDNVQTRLGLRVSMTGQSSLDKGSARKFEPYAEVNWLWNSEQYGVTMGDASDHLKGSRSVAELKAGVEGRITDKLGLWGSVAQQVGGHSFSDTQGMVGVKYTF